MSDKIATPSEIFLRMMILKETIKFLKDHHIGENSSRGQLISELAKKIEDRLVSDPNVEVRNLPSSDH